MTTFERIKKIFVESFEVRDELIAPDTQLESLGLDSLDKIDLMFALEDEFKIKIPEREVKLSTVQEVVDSLDKLIAEQDAPRAAGDNS
ncbi:MAG TPA: phosphopantetheine-binding protein [Dissulfurispiraceae bacterium]